MTSLKLAYPGHVCLDLYKKPHSQDRWHLPVCSSLRKEELFRLSPKSPSRWEDVDIDGCPTMCFSFTGKAVRAMNRAKSFTSFFAQFSGYVGEGPAKAFFYDLWLKDHNLRALARNQWEYKHRVRTTPSSPRTMSVRAAARSSIV